MSTLAERVQGRTALTAGDLAHLQLLVAEWQLVADLSFADLVLWVVTHEQSWLAVAHIRPTTGPTTYPSDVVGTELAETHRLQRAWREGRIVRDGEPEWHDQIPVRTETIPVARNGQVVAVLSRDTNLKAARVPSQLELAYLTAAGELLQMVAEGVFPFPGTDPDPEHAPRVGDGLLRLDRTGHVVYASPNAASAYRRLGLTGDLLGVHLGSTTSALGAGPGRMSEPQGSAALSAALRHREPRDSELEARGAVVALRVLPLFPAGAATGALVLVRDVTELRRRDRAILGKDATIREIHHRVKNNLQTVAALLRMQARRMDDPVARSALEESVRRVASIAAVHETLSTALDEQVAFDAVATRVAEMCAEVAATGAQVTVELRGTFGVLPAQLATSLSMVLTELVQNAVEHAYPEGRGGRIVIAVDRTGDRLQVDVVDDGAGLPAAFDLAASKRLGLQIVRTLVSAELGGELELAPAEPDGDRTQGTRATLVLPLMG